jgi:hypothetical protein
VKTEFIDLDLTDIPDGQSSGWIEQPPEDLLGSWAGIPWLEEIAGGTEMVSRAEWKARAGATSELYRSSVAEIYSQGRTSACVGFGTAQAVETTLTRAYGRRHRVPLAGMDVYSDIGRSLMSGAYIPDGIDRASEIGILPLRTQETEGVFPVTFPGLEYKWDRPAGWKAVAAQFRVTKAAKVQGGEMIASALLRGRCVIVGRSRHCIPYVYLDFAGNSPVAAYANSWGREWSDDGFGFDSERTFSGLVGYVPLEVEFRPGVELPPIS